MCQSSESSEPLSVLHSSAFPTCSAQQVLQKIADMHQLRAKFCVQEHMRTGSLTAQKIFRAIGACPKHSAILASRRAMPSRDQKAWQCCMGCQCPQQTFNMVPSAVPTGDHPAQASHLACTMLQPQPQLANPAAHDGLRGLSMSDFRHENMQLSEMKLSHQAMTSLIHSSTLGLQATGPISGT